MRRKFAVNTKVDGIGRNREVGQRPRRWPAVTWAFDTSDRRPVVWLIWKTVMSPQVVHAAPSARAQALVVALKRLLVVGRVVVQHQQVVARGVGDQPERIDALGIEGLLGVRMPLPPTANWVMLEFWQGSAGGAVGVALRRSRRGSGHKETGCR